MKLATVKFICDRKGSRFEVTGPSALLAEYQYSWKTYDFNGYKTYHNTAWDNWGVKCSKTGEIIALNDLLYWDNDEQLAFKGPEQALEHAKEKNWFKSSTEK